MVSLVPDYADSSLSSSRSSEESDTERSPTQSVSRKLPPPTFSNKVKNSVFLNPYLEAENAKIAVLDKHVQNLPQEESEASNKVNKICWMFKKGRCNYGKKCRFSHIINGTEQKINTDFTPSTAEPEVQEEHPLSPNEDSDEEGAKKRKKRPGLTKGLIPSKKVIKLYKKIKKEEEHSGKS